MLIDGTQPVHAQTLPELMQHPGGGHSMAQPGEAPPGTLFRQLGHQQIERMRGRQQRQQMGAPQLRRTQGMPSPTGEVGWTYPGDKIIRSIRTQQFEQPVRADGRQGQTHVQTLTHATFRRTPLVSA